MYKDKDRTYVLLFTSECFESLDVRRHYTNPVFYPSGASPAWHIVLYHPARVHCEAISCLSLSAESWGGSPPTQRILHIPSMFENEIMNDHFRERHRKEFEDDCEVMLSFVLFFWATWYVGIFLCLQLIWAVFCCHFSLLPLQSSSLLSASLLFLCLRCPLCYLPYPVCLSVIIGSHDCWPFWQIFRGWTYLLGTQFIWVHGLTPCFLSGPLMLGQDFLRQPYQLEPQHWNILTDQDRTENTTIVTQVCLYDEMCTSV